MISEPAVRALRTAVIRALQSGVQAVDSRVYTLPAPQNGTFPYLTVGSYTEQRDNFFGRAGSAVEFDIKGYYRNPSGQYGDAGALEMYEEVHRTLQGTTLEVDEHLHLLGNVLFSAGPYMDKDGLTLQWVARYEGNTKNVVGGLS